MKEQDYINVTELTRVRDMISIFGNIISGNSEVISETERKEVGEKLHQWRERLEEKVNTQ